MPIRSHPAADQLFVYQFSSTAQPSPVLWNWPSPPNVVDRYNVNSKWVDVIHLSPYRFVMVGTWGKKNFRIAWAAFALLGVVHFASLLPNHLISELRHILFVSDYGSFADFICESGKSRSEQPGGKTSNCPFCKGLAAFQLAVVETPPAINPQSAFGQKIAASEAALLAIAFLVKARSRGPPART